MTPSSNRVILYYNGAISALTLFVQHPDAGVCTPCPLPLLSEILDADAEDMDYAAAVDSVSAIGKVMGLPEGIEPIAMTPLGYPDDAPRPTSRKPRSEVVRRDRW